MTVHVNPNGRVSKPLSTLEAARHSVLEFTLQGLPQDMENVCVHIGRPGSDSYEAVAASPLPDGCWSVYASGLYFPEVGRADWHLTSKDRKGRSRYHGMGTLRIVESVLNENGAQTPSLIPEDTYVRNPRTGLWHKLTAKFEDGEIVPIIDPEGIER